MDDPDAVKAAKSPGGLDGDIQNPFQDLLGISLVKFSCLNMMSETSAFLIGGENENFILNRSKKIAGNQVHVLRKVDPLK
jgi:hypothetical protein